MWNALYGLICRTQCRGKSKDEHYSRITNMILNICKDIWLESSSGQNASTAVNTDEAVALKRALAGFYLMYTMFEKQPIQEKVKISLDLYDQSRLAEFAMKIKKLPFYNEVAFMMRYLQCKEAFHYCVYAERVSYSPSKINHKRYRGYKNVFNYSFFCLQFQFEASTRNFLNTCKSDAVALTKEMRRSQEYLANSSVNTKCEQVFEKMADQKKTMMKWLLKSVNPEVIQQHMMNQSLLNMFIRTVCGDHTFKEAMSKLDSLIRKPVMTLQSLTATDATDQRIMSETLLRMERARKKSCLGTSKLEEGDPKLSRPYVREGGIFGRKRENDEGEEKVKRRERGACVGNLWTYIYEKDFTKPEQKVDDGEEYGEQERHDLKDDAEPEGESRFARMEGDDLEEKKSDDEDEE